MVYGILESGDLLVRYANNALAVFNPEVLTKVRRDLHRLATGRNHMNELKDSLYGLFCKQYWKRHRLTQ